jgi:hypothetical protein
MADLVATHCPVCHSVTDHDHYLSRGGYLHSLCTNCGKDISSSERVESGEPQPVTKHCAVCGVDTAHVRYLSTTGYLHWLCLSCGKDVRSSANVQ